MKWAAAGIWDGHPDEFVYHDRSRVIIIAHGAGKGKNDMTEKYFAERPEAAPVDVAYLPDELCDQGRFCVWRYELSNQRWAKVPYNPRTKRRASVHDLEDFADLEDALDALNAGPNHYDGIGVLITGDIAGVDIDHCVDDAGNLSDEARDIVSIMGDTYTERSPSGTGIRIICTVPKDFEREGIFEQYKEKAGNIEVYIAGVGKGRYLTITGDALETDGDTAGVLRERGDALHAVLSKYMTRSMADDVSTPASTDTANEYADRVKQALESDEKFRALWNGDVSGYPSQSEADAALCCKLAFWTVKNPTAIDRLFRQSGLYRDKWERSDYRQRTIWKALETCQDVYTGGRPGDPPPVFTAGGDPADGPAGNCVEEKINIDMFLSAIYSDRYRPIPTGLKELDDGLLKGGFMAQTLCILGAAPGAGKTTLCQEVFESMAASGRRALFYNLEMSAVQLIARSLARRIYLSETGEAKRQRTGYKLGATDIMRGYEHTKLTREQVVKAAHEYFDAVGGRLDYRTGKTDVDEILRDIRKAGDAARASGEPAPDICIDYIQLLTSEAREEPVETVKRALTELKQYAIKYGAVVMCITAQNRITNKGTESTLYGGRDTGALEYSADLYLQLVREDPDNKPNEVTLHVVKSRFGSTTGKKGGRKYTLRGPVSYLDPWTDVKTHPFDKPASTEPASTNGDGQAETPVMLAPW